MSKAIACPKLQVPELKNSLNNFLTSVKPLISEKSYLEIVKSTESFAVNEAPYLQSKLLTLAEGTENWASDLWVESRFLSNRTSALFTAHSSTFRRKYNWQSLEEMLASVSVFIQYMMNALKDFRNDNQPQEFLGGVPLCMSLYKRIGGSHRLPGKTTDTQMFSPESRHIVVLHGGNIFKMPVYTSGGVIVSLYETFHLLKEVIKYPQDSTDHVSMGLLTANVRDIWYSCRQELTRSPINSGSLKVIEESLFGICLDESIHCDVITATKVCRFGGKAGEFSLLNRWFDLGFQAAFTRDGYLTLMDEHSLMDGSVVANFFSLLPKLEEPILIDPKPILADESLQVELLKWEIPQEITSQLKAIQIKLSDWYTHFDLYEHNYEKYGKSFLKENKIYLHGFLHVVLQLTYFKLYNNFVSTFTAASLRNFSHGRLAHPHTLTLEVKQFVESFLDEGLMDSEKWGLLENALLRHKEILSQTVQGDVYVKHMLALKKLSEQEHISVELFDDPSFEIFSRHKLTFISIFLSLGIVLAYPPSESDQHSITFQVDENSIHSLVTTIHGSIECVSSEKFVQEIEISLNSLYQLVLTHSTQKLSV